VVRTFNFQYLARQSRPKLQHRCTSHIRKIVAMATGY